MTSTDHAHHDPQGMDTCAWVLERIQAFLHGELGEADAQAFREHLMACEDCMDETDLEQAVARAVRRCCPPTTASAQLRMRIVEMRVDRG